MMPLAIAMVLAELAAPLLADRRRAARGVADPLAGPPEVAIMSAPVVVWGLPFAPLTLAGTVDAIEELVEAGRPSYFITANTHYAMLSSQIPRLAEVNAAAALWWWPTASRRSGPPGSRGRRCRSGSPAPT